ncbi:MAG: class I poly(R)-hydroxyalkanoic acid synthase [Rhodospirillales bacterium]|nr:class I poly(R)-hydroxyalkanoic acid synthase [Rhodospirillales bacterium]
MSDNQEQKTPTDQQAEMVEAYRSFCERSQSIAQAFMERQVESDGYQVSDPVVVGKAFMDLAGKMFSDPAGLLEAQTKLWQQYTELWGQTARRMAGEDFEAVRPQDRAEKRFKDESWTEDAIYDFIKQSYLMTSDWIYSSVRNVDGLDKNTSDKVNFYTRQFVNALSPTNFALTNPKVMREATETNGESLLKGFDNLLNDLEKGKGELKISMSDQDAFTPGENIATSKGKVIYQNELMQLLQYTPSTEKVAKRPLLIVPPWINKFYILDLQPRNSFIKWAVDQGHTVFVISWVNPDENLSSKTFDDYMLEGPLAAIDAIEQVTGVAEVNLIGYCIGGTLTACTLAYMADKGDKRAKSATFFTSMVDFSDPGELGVFIDEEQIGLLEEHMLETGYLESSHMSQVFNMMRDNDLIWSFVINNYLMGREPIAFDLLYWNSDSTRMPNMMHSFYLREMYLGNKLCDPGGVTLDGVGLDLSKIDVPVYWVSTIDDHIAPWKSTYAATNIYSGSKRFVLSGSGHIAGVINPPEAKKYGYWTNNSLPSDPEVWLEKAKQHEGSWWNDWQKWVGKQAGGSVKARVPGKGKLKALEDAPGSYVKVRAS